MPVQNDRQFRIPVIYQLHLSTVWIEMVMNASLIQGSYDKFVSAIVDYVLDEKTKKNHKWEWPSQWSSYSISSNDTIADIDEQKMIWIQC